MPLVHISGFKHLQVWSQTVDLLGCGAFSPTKFFPVSVVFMNNLTAQDPLVDSAKGGEDAAPTVPVHRLTGIKLLGGSLLEPGASDGAIP